LNRWHPSRLLSRQGISRRQHRAAVPMAKWSVRLAPTRNPIAPAVRPD
jgi:hypothetical protein